MDAERHSKKQQICIKTLRNLETEDRLNLTENMHKKTEAAVTPATRNPGFLLRSEQACVPSPVPTLTLDKAGHTKCED